MALYSEEITFCRKTCIVLIFIEFIGVTLVNKLIQVSSVQFSNTSFVYCIVCSSPKVKSPFLTIDHPPPLYSLLLSRIPFLSGNRHAVVCVYEVGFLFFLIPSHISPPSTLSLLSPVNLLSVSVSLFPFCSLDSIYKWNHKAFVFLFLAYFT